MGSRPRPQLVVADVVDRMFGDVFTADERAELVEWIQAWEDAHPDVPQAERVTAWIDVAYAFQERGASRSSWSPARPSRDAPHHAEPTAAALL
jgi:hypothetical protein